MDMIHYGSSNIGKKRNLNEDSMLVDAEHNLFVVADGMGGHNAGEVASAKAIEVFQEYIKIGFHDEDYGWLQKVDQHFSPEENVIIGATKIANKSLFSMASESEDLKGMGTTLTGAVFEKNAAYVFNVGDSRVYSYKNGTLLQLTEDHSWVNEQLKLNLITTEEAKSHRWKNVITRALGTTADIDVDVFVQPIESGDLFLICSDGLTSMLEDVDIKKVVESYRLSLEDMVNELIDEANANGGLDNISIIAVEVI